MEEDKSSSQNVKNAMCYIPLVAFFLYFAEKKRTPDYERHMKYGMLLFLVFIVGCIFLRSAFIGFLFLAYILSSAFFAYRAYNKEDVKVEFVDSFLDNVNNKVGKKENPKEEEEKK